MSLNQLSKLLPLPDADLQQVLDYASTLTKAEAASHFSNLLGDSPAAVEFTSSFNSRRQDPRPPQASSSSRGYLTPSSAPGSAPTSAPASDSDAVPKPGRAAKKKKAQIHTPAPRQVTNTGPVPGTVYSKRNVEEEYMAGSSGGRTGGGAVPSRQPTTAAIVAGTATSASRTPPPDSVKFPPLKSATPPPQQQQRMTTAAGYLISDAHPRGRPKSNPASRSSTPGPPGSGRSTPASRATAATKVSITGGVAMHGASAALSDLDAAIRALQITANPSLQGADDAAQRRCNCVAARHPLLAAAPNCLTCGKVVCVKEGLGPCTFCGTPLVSADEARDMLRELTAERGREKMAADKAAHRRADVAGPRVSPYARAAGARDEVGNAAAAGATKGGAVAEAEARAREHRDRLLQFQADNARRTTVRDEASDFDVGLAALGGGNIWSTPEERARELARQQHLLREMEWNARPDYEKRRQVLSIDLVGGKVVRTTKLAPIERPATPPPPAARETESEDYGYGYGHSGDGAGVDTGDQENSAGAGRYARNPLLGGLIKPVYDATGEHKALPGRTAGRWSRVQDDLADNEDVILDGGAYAGMLSRAESMVSAREEPGKG